MVRDVGLESKRFLVCHPERDPGAETESRAELLIQRAGKPPGDTIVLSDPPVPWVVRPGANMFSSAGGTGWQRISPMKAVDFLEPAKLRSVLDVTVWDVDLAAVPRWKAFLVRTFRIAYLVVHDLTEGELNLRAMSLVYTTLLSLVPLLAISFSVLKGFGVHNEIEPLLENTLAPLGDRGKEITVRLMGFVENMNAGVLGSLGLGMLVYTVISLIQKIEKTFNHTWHVEKGRALAQRFSDYLSVILIGPVLVFSALGVTATVMGTDIVQRLVVIQPFGLLVAAASRLAPYVLLAAAFTFLYVFLPNTKVRLGAALVGGTVAAVLWQTTGWAFAAFIVTSAQYTLIYSTLAALIMFMIWVYLAWLILLVGASIAFYYQHPEYVVAPRGELRLSNRIKEKLALLVMLRVAQNYYQRRRPWSRQELATRLRAPMTALDATLSGLVATGLLALTEDRPPRYLPACPLDATPLSEILGAIRTAEEKQSWNGRRLETDPVVDTVSEELEVAVNNALKARTLKDLTMSEETSSPVSVK